MKKKKNTKRKKQNKKTTQQNPAIQVVTFSFSDQKKKEITNNSSSSSSSMFQVPAFYKSRKNLKLNRLTDVSECFDDVTLHHQDPSVLWCCSILGHKLTACYE